MATGQAAWCAMVGQYMLAGYGLACDKIDSAWLSERLCECGEQDMEYYAAAFVITDKWQRGEDRQ